MALELSVVGLNENERSHKYILCAGFEDRIIYAVGSIHDSHKKIFESLPDAKHVFGGGSACAYSDRLGAYSDRLVLSDYSGAYGGVPKQILEHFSPDILAAYQKIWPNMTRVDCNPKEIFEREERRMESWDSLAKRWGVELK